jgi:cytidyltransferase-like protein
MNRESDWQLRENQSTKCATLNGLSRLVTAAGGKQTGQTRLRPKYDLVAMGGTFDVLHRGHKQLLRQAFSVGRRVVIGVTTDSFAHTLHKPHKVDPYAKRKRDLQKLLARWHVLSRARVVPIDDRFGPTVLNSRIDALVVSRRTLKTAQKINARRKRNGLRPLVIDPIELIMAEDRRPISSTRIRRGRIDREGRLVKRE